MSLVPPPPADVKMERRLVEVLSDVEAGVFTWEALSSERFDGWLGVRFGKDPLWLNRPWTFDIVSSDADVKQAGHPLMVPARADVVVVEIEDRSRPWVSARMVCDLPDAVDEVDVPVSAWPPTPWQVEVRTGWSTSSVASAVQGWIVDRTGRRDLLVADGSDTANTQMLSPALNVDSSALDRLLSLDPCDAAVVCTFLEAFAQALTRH